VGGRPAGPWGSIPRLGRVRTAAGGLRRWHRAAPAAAASSLARGRQSRSVRGWWKLQGMLGEALGCWSAVEAGGATGSAAAAHMARWGSGEGSVGLARVRELGALK
jgi:hypothetical protein